MTASTRTTTGKLHASPSRIQAKEPTRPGLLERRWPLALGAVFLLAWVWRLLYLQRLSHTVLAGSLTEDSRVYWTWSRILIEHGFLGKNPFFFGPLYPYVLALLRLVLGESIGAMLQVQALWGAAAAVLLADAARRLTRPAFGLAAGVAVALYPMAVFFDGLVLMESLLFFLESLLLWWIVRRGDVAQTPRTLLATGALIGLIAEGRATAATLLVPAALFLLPWRGIPRARLARAAAALAAGFALVALPVAVRTWAVSGEWVPFTYNFGFNLYAGNNPEAPGTFSTITGTQIIGGEIREDGGTEADGREYLRTKEGVTLGPRASSDYWAAKAWRWIQGHPGAAFGLALRKLGMMWSHREYAQIEHVGEFARLAGPLGFGSFVLLGSLAFPGLMLAWGRGRHARFVMGYVVVLTLAVLPFFVVDRYRHHLIPGVILLAALTLERAWSLAWRREARRLAVLGAATVAGLAATFAPGPALSARKFEWGLAMDLGARWLERRRPDLAVESFERAVRLEPPGGAFVIGSSHATERADLYYNYGLALHDLKRDAEAIRWFEHAVEVAPDRAPALRALAEACLRAGQAARAESLYAALATKVRGGPRADEGLGMIAAREGRLSEAAARFDRAVRSDPRLIDAWGALIRAQVQLGRVAAAESALARADSAGLPAPFLKAHQALVLILAGRRAAAAKALAEVPDSTIASDPVLADVVSVARRALGKTP